MKILLAGGAGYIGSHTAIQLIEAEHEIVIADNYENSSPEVIKRISELCGKEIKAYEVDVIGRRECLTIFGNDYPTADGTCRRDYVHVMDLADGHVKAVEYTRSRTGIDIFNLGTGIPYSVLDIVHSFEKANNVEVKYEFGARREGDIAQCWAKPDKAKKFLDGRQREVWRICAVIPGTGKNRIQTDIISGVKLHEYLTVSVKDESLMLMEYEIDEKTKK